MEPLYYTRIATSGWIFLTILFTSFWGSKSDQWKYIMSLINDKNIDISLAITGAIAGISAPPAFGFLIEGVNWFLVLISGQQPWYYHSNKLFKANFEKIFINNNKTRFCNPPGAIFSVFFFSNASPDFLYWARRRLTNFYANLNAMLSIIIALIIVWLLNSLYIPVLISSLFLIVILSIRAYLEGNIHKKTISTWVDTVGVAVLKNFSSQLNNQQITSQYLKKNDV